MEQRELFDKYKVIFLDDCFDTKAGSISNRLEKLYQSLGTRLNKGPEILENISSGCEGQGTAKMFDFVERAEKCSTYAQLQELDRNLGAKKQSRDLWRHIKSPFLGQKEVTVWEFKLTKHGRIYCYIEHQPAKTILILDSASKDTEAHKNNVSKIERIAMVAEDIFKVTNGSGFFADIRKELETPNKKQEEISPLEEKMFEEIGFIRHLEHLSVTGKDAFVQVKKYEWYKTMLKNRWQKLENSNDEVFNLLKEKIATEKKERETGTGKNFLFTGISDKVLFSVADMILEKQPDSSKKSKGVELKKLFLKKRNER